MTSNQCLSPNGCLLGYVDNDADSFGNSNLSARFCGALPTAPTRYVATSGDCCDANATVRPNQTAYFSTPISTAGCTAGFNYDCSYKCTLGLGCIDTIAHEYPQTGCVDSCSPASDCNGTGWGGTYPGCGSTGTRRTCGTATTVCLGGRIIGCTTGLSLTNQPDRCH